MAASRIHLRNPDRAWNAACGRPANSSTTTRTALVTCQRCQSTEAFQRRANPDAQSVLDQIAEALDQWAEGEGLCDQYEEAVSVAQGVAEAWGLQWPEPSRPRRWEVSLTDWSVEATSEEDALREIAENIGSFIRVMR